MSAGPALGSVHVFNCYNEPVTGLSVAGYVAGSIGALADDDTFTPQSIPVPRARTRPTTAAFAIGATTVIVPWDSFRGTTTVTVPDPADGAVSLTDPLLLALSPSGSALLTQRGYVLSFSAMAIVAGRVPPPGA